MLLHVREDYDYRYLANNGLKNSIVLVVRQLINIQKLRGLRNDGCQFFKVPRSNLKIYAQSKSDAQNGKTRLPENTYQNEDGLIDKISGELNLQVLAKIEQQENIAKISTDCEAKDDEQLSKQWLQIQK